MLLVDDSPDDVLLIRLALARAGITHSLIVVPDGEKALQYLKGETPYADHVAFPLPQLVLLDLAMPRMGGFEVLDWIRHQPQLRQMPVIVLTGSSLLADARRAYQMGASSFITKPADLTGLTLALREMTDFWLRRSRLPALRSTRAEQPTGSSNVQRLKGEEKQKVTA
jgi:CheY-like chemotaxis protein